MMDIREQAIEAARIINDLFLEGINLPPIPADATVESLWLEIQTLKNNVKKPKKVEAIKLLLEDERLVGLSIPLMADIIKKIYAKHSVKCDTSPAAIRWYISQKTLEWNIKPRDKSIADLLID